MIKKLLVQCFCMFPLLAFAQYDSTATDSAYNVGEVVVTGILPNNPRFTSLNIAPYNFSVLNEKSPFNLSDALAKIPGISQITTGNSITKPVIRGLYGNRILVLLSGLRFDNQQWQDEHGLGLSQMGIERVEIIKGPASLLYGSEAMGGVINIIEEKPVAQGVRGSAGTVFYSNTAGTLTDAGFGSRVNNRWHRVRAGIENHADYTDGRGRRVLNSRNKGYYLKAGAGFEKKRWFSENSYNFSYNQYGFILEDLPAFFNEDSRQSRVMSGPHHNVMLNLFNSQNTIFLTNSILKLNGGVQSNLRMEDEGGGQISLKMHLLSLLQSLRWEKSLGSNARAIINQQFTYTSNKNYGARIIIPDASMAESNVSGFLQLKYRKLIIEAGGGVNHKFINTVRTRLLNAPGGEVQPFTVNKITANGMAGLACNLSGVILKANIATGFRAPNLAELSSNGLHEGVFRYEIGNPNLKTEQNFNSDASAEIKTKQWFINVSAFYNRFLNYVYLAPTAENFFGFPVFRFRQQNAALYGGEFFMSFAPSRFNWVKLKETFTLTEGRLDNGGNLPFIPAWKLTSAVRLERTGKGKSPLFFEPELVYVAPQTHPAQFETATPAYYLLNFTSGITLPARNGNWQVGITATNLTSQVYADHLSRLKYFGLYNQGINFSINIRKEFKW